MMQWKQMLAQTRIPEAKLVMNFAWWEVKTVKKYDLQENSIKQVQNKTPRKANKCPLKINGWKM